MKKTFVIISLLLIISGMTSQSIAQERKYFKFNGPGWGIPYGGIPGLNLEVSPIEYFAVTAGLGYNTPVGFGWALGAKVYFFRQNKLFRPYLSAHHGVVTTLEKLDEIKYDHGIGNAYGIGMELSGSGNKGACIDLGIHLIDFTSPEGYEEFVGRGWRTISLAMGFYY